MGAELLFMQSYFEGIWGLTWSLAVEEHFYLLLPLLVLLLRDGRCELRYRWSRPSASVCCSSAHSALPGSEESRRRDLGSRARYSASHCTHGPTIRRRGDRVLLHIAIRQATRTAFKTLAPAAAHCDAGRAVIILFAPKQMVLSVGLTVLSSDSEAMVLTAACSEARSPGTIAR